MSSQRHRMLAGEPYAAPAADAPRPAATPGCPALSHGTPGRTRLSRTPLGGPAFHRKAPAPRGI
ncbi:hypothetical protein [Streptomyces sp. Rer75]|uniref:hypothetical protein n=1 Tax=unclassified Streptomyces TaxID=2593676 RepID=UPI0015CF9852|nr:hypothetical protein [Streptomyces sp. Rer75]QLH26013.1 hypothetical protein HYQ63_39905 [Streptomyces sp. Rer75]